MTDLVTKAQAKLSRLDAQEQMKLLFPSTSFLSKKLTVLLAVCGALLYLFFGDKSSIVPAIVQLASVYLIVQGLVDINTGWVNVFKAKHLGVQEDIQELPPT
jgi:uncharacterized membrane protein YoaK (UPF0700 family)